MSTQTSYVQLSIVNIIGSDWSFNFFKIIVISIQTYSI